MDTIEFKKTYEAQWDHIDPVGHLRGPVLIDYVINTQFAWSAQYGYGQDRLAAAGYEPIVLKLEARFLHESFIGETLTDIPWVVGLAEDGSMWKTYHEITNNKGEKVGTFKLEGTFFSWKSRKTVLPEKEMLEVLQRLQRKEPFEKMRPLPIAKL
jgi:acyl-CoA thioesterase FadM